jgi:hypothetical protein
MRHLWRVVRSSRMRCSAQPFSFPASMASDEQAGTDGPKAADEPVAHIGVVIAAERWQEVGLSKHHPVSPDQHDREEDANDPNDHASLEERFPEKAVV